MPHYVKQHWSELRGDAYDAWGTSWWYFEVQEDGEVSRQIERYESGVSLKYSNAHMADEFGFLTDRPLDISDTGYLSLSHQDFEEVWQQAKAFKKCE